MNTVRRLTKVNVAVGGRKLRSDQAETNNVRTVWVTLVILHAHTNVHICTHCHTHAYKYMYIHTLAHTH